MSPGDNAPIGILLCTEKNHALVRYALAGMSNRLFVSKYQLALPKEDEMRAFVEARLGEVLPLSKIAETKEDRGKTRQTGETPRKRKPRR